MAQAQLSMLVRNLRRRAAGAAAGVPDSHLLDRFVREHDEAAFELLLRRHERLVFSVCQRILGRQQDAEDAFQATFLVLASKAAAIGKREALGSWLYQVARRIAWRERARARSRADHERRAVFERARMSPALQPSDCDTGHVLYEEVSRLPEKYRAPVVLCYLEGQTNEQAGRQLSCPAATVATRLARARQRLRRGLERRGVALSAGALALLLSRQATAAALLPAFRCLTLRAALAFVADDTALGLVSPKVILLTRGVLRAMFLHKLKTVLAVVASVILIGAGSGMLAGSGWLAEGNSDPLPSRAAIFAQQQERQENPAPQKSKNARKRAGESERRTVSEQVNLKDVVSKSFKTGKTPRVIVEMFNGGITVDATGKSGVQVQATKFARAADDKTARDALEKLNVNMSQDGDTITVRAEKPEQAEPRPRNVSSGISAELKVPAGAVLELQTANGSVSVTGGNGKVKVKTSNGKIETKDAKGPLHLHTSNGTIVVTGGQNRLELKTSNGPIEIRGERTAVTAETSNGQVKFEGSFAAGKHLFRTSNGQITLTLPADAGFKLHARTSHGSIKSEFGKNTSQGGTRSRSRTQLDLSVGDNPDASLDLHTSNGGITIRRQQAQRQE